MTTTRKGLTMTTARRNDNSAGMRVNNVIRVRMRSDEISKSWLLMLHPMHKMSSREMALATIILEWCRSVGIDKSITDELRDKAKKELGVSRSYLRVMLTRLRKAGFLLDDGKVNKRFIPDDNGGGHFRFMIDFVIDG